MLAVALFAEGAFHLLLSRLLFFFHLDGHHFGGCFHHSFGNGFFHLIVYGGYYGFGKRFGGDVFHVFADARTATTFALLFVSIGLFRLCLFHVFFLVHRLLLFLNYNGFGRLLRFFVLLGLLFFLVGFGSLLDVGMVHLMVDDGVNQVGSVLLLVVDAHFGGNEFEVVQRLLVQFKNCIHKLIDVIFRME